MATLRIKVGASVDRSLTTAYQPLVEAARKARVAIEGELNRTTATRARSAKTAQTAEEKAAAAGAKAAEKAANATAKAAEKAAREEVRSREKAERQKQRAVEDTERKANLALARQQKAEERAAQQRVEQMRRFESKMNPATRGGAIDTGAIRGMVGDRVASGAFAAARWGAGAAASIAGSAFRGTGINLNMDQHMSGAVDLEKRSVDLSNAGYMPGAVGVAGRRQDPRQLAQQARDVANYAGMDSGNVMEGLQAFTAKTGDLETGRAVLKDMAMLSRATGTSMEDMVSAAGDVSNGLGDTDHKAEKIATVMRAIAAQGKVGAVEIKDLAVQMAKVQAAAGKFTGGGEKNIAEMNAMVQMARARGGAASATQAATGVLSFTNTFSKAARRKEFRKQGIELEGQDGRLRGAKDILMESLQKTGGDTEKMGKLFADAGARRSVAGFEAIYKENGGGDAGLRAVSQKFDELADATMNSKEVTDSFARSMNTTEAQAQLFNNQLGVVAGEMQSALLPALKELAPVAVSAAKEFSGFIETITGTKEARDKERQDKVEGDAKGSMAIFDRGMASKTHTVSATDVTQGRDAEEALKAQIRKKAKEAEELGKGAHLNEKSGGWFAKHDPTGFVAKKEEKRKEAAMDLARLQQELAKIQQANQQMTAALQSGVLRVEVVKQPAPAAPLPGVSDDGRTNNPQRPQR